MVDKQTHELDLNPNLVIDGKQYYYCPAHQLAKHICKQTYDEFRLTCKLGFTSASIYIEKILQAGGQFISTKYGKKKCIGVLFYDIETNHITLQKTNVEIFKFNEEEFFSIQYEIFKYLRDSDLIRICTIERKIRNKQNYIYTITKLKAGKNGRLFNLPEIDTQFFIPKSDFICSESTNHLIKRRKRG